MGRVRRWVRLREEGRRGKKGWDRTELHREMLYMHMVSHTPSHNATLHFRISRPSVSTDFTSWMTPIKFEAGGTSISILH